MTPDLRHIVNHRLTWEQEDALDALFGRMWTIIFPKPEPFAPGSPCEFDLCDAVASGRILVNVWGTITEHDACDRHRAFFHGKNLDYLPLRLPDTAGASS
jgi:hypothetical protein